jgi:amino-acid N-acetyltransferase
MTESADFDPADVTLRKAAVVDVKTIHRMIMHFADRRQMLGRSLSKLYEHVREFYVAEAVGEIVACGALHVVWDDLGEVRSLAVRAGFQRKGLGQRIVRACIDEARQLGLPRVFCLTYVPDFFRMLGFEEVDKSVLPHKVWAECVNCPQFPDCGEVPLMLELTETGEKP